ncbi:hypothetical protein DSM106972_056910 [Dulcicalothrix desertica PCC 7102]|uniref:Uncharacterized protein n=1 Tax=Dulcicalothrix desertica PCC 7102 TaxID=232991 RepID=A0A433V9J4_9CYAN|nr:hypothetical protein [Dulcicalothrix desertica]MBW4600049.1 hypothetical protein [Calothrix sp. FI2-JRJ7]RUT02771.1 hypothetical protein DSM106972_056910 [Dulcicalothrix desertica PCC 7102]TWH38994.1 hypothetical protein CAL7102_08197 [Dulcicalothrix desertica PCC 7102]
MSISTVSERSSVSQLASNLNKTFYQVDQQVKFMHLQAEVECLLQELQNLNTQRLTAIKPE